MSENKKFCKNCDQDVEVSKYNKDGNCQCLNCTEPECKTSDCEFWQELYYLRWCQFKTLPCQYCQNHTGRVK